MTWVDRPPILPLGGREESLVEVPSLNEGGVLDEAKTEFLAKLPRFPIDELDAASKTHVNFRQYGGKMYLRVRQVPL